MIDVREHDGPIIILDDWETYKDTTEAEARDTPVARIERGDWKVEINTNPDGDQIGISFKGLNYKNEEYQDFIYHYDEDSWYFWHPAWVKIQTTDGTPLGIIKKE